MGGRGLIAGFIALLWLGSTQAAAGAGEPSPARGLRLLGNQTVLGDVVTLTPSDPAAEEVVDGPTILSVQVGADAARSTVVLFVNQSFNWHQIVTPSPVEAQIGLRLFIASSALPAPGSFEALGPFAEGRVVSGSSSSEDNVHSAGWQPRYALDLDLLRINLQFAYPTLTAPEVDALATAVMHADLRFSLQPQATIRSVSRVSFGRVRSLQVWGN